VEAELGLLGVPSVDHAIGALGKIPGGYFRQQEDSSRMLLDAFLRAVDYALNIPEAGYWEMSHTATRAAFPFGMWIETSWRFTSGRSTTPGPGKKRQLHPLAHMPRGLEDPQRDVALKTNCFCRRSSTSVGTQQMQVLDITDDVEFPAQTVSEQRVHDIIKEALRSTISAAS
jgi:hypothetical protein